MIKRMAKGRNPKQEVVDIEAIVKKVAKIADEKKADYIKILDMRSRLIITDYFVIISARNTRLTKRIKEEICINLKIISGILLMLVDFLKETGFLSIMMIL